MAIHRFKCSNELNDEIIKFSQIHKFDTNETLKEQWDSWMNTDKMVEIIEQEKSFLHRNHYNSQIDVKIFKSIKYYYIKLFLKPEVEKEPVTRSVNRLPIELKQKIQEDICKNFESNIAFKPSDTYEPFLKTISNESLQVVGESAIKKCYKNQYYQMKHKKYDINLNAE